MPIRFLLNHTNLLFQDSPERGSTEDISIQNVRGRLRPRVWTIQSTNDVHMLEMPVYYPIANFSKLTYTVTNDDAPTVCLNQHTIGGLA
jgi:hypothetical protein